jgi:hypothetical protein
MMYLCSRCRQTATAMKRTAKKSMIPLHAHLQLIASRTHRSAWLLRTSFQRTPTSIASISGTTVCSTPISGCGTIWTTAMRNSAHHLFSNSEKLLQLWLSIAAARHLAWRAPDSSANCECRRACDERSRNCSIVLQITFGARDRVSCVDSHLPNDNFDSFNLNMRRTFDNANFDKINQSSNFSTQNRAK